MFEYIKDNLQLLTFMLTVAFGIFDRVIAYRKEQREARKERAERQKQLELTENKDGAYPPRKDKHR